MEVVFILLLIVVAAIVFWKKARTAKAGRYKAGMQKTTNDCPMKEGPGGSMDVFVAGLAHHCRQSDVGVFHGTVYNEKNNPVNNEAMAVWDNRTQKVIGYVPEAILDEYRHFCDGRRCTCIGYIYDDGEYLRGRIRAYREGMDSDAVKSDMDGYAKAVADHFGWPA